MLVKALFAVAGLCVGAAQFFLTSRAAFLLASKRFAPGMLAMTGKTVLYIAFFAVVVWFLDKGSMFLAIGYGVGLLLLAAVNMIRTIKKNGRS